MANALTLVELSKGTLADANDAVTIDTSTGVYLDIDGYDSSKILFVFTCSTLLDSGDTITVSAGTAYSAVGQGDLSLVPSGSTESGTKWYLSGLESARYKDSNDRINITAGTTEITAVEAILLP